MCITVASWFTYVSNPTIYIHVLILHMYVLQYHIVKIGDMLLCYQFTARTIINMYLQEPIYYICNRIGLLCNEVHILNKLCDWIYYLHNSQY